MTERRTAAAGPLPETVAGLPVCPKRHLPIPFATEREADGIGRFGANDPLAKLLCGIGRRCGVCGGRLGDGEIVFLAVDRGHLGRRPVFTDPAMHEPCAEASMALCPFIARARTAGRASAGPKPGWVMLVTRSYELVPGRHALADFLPGPAVHIRRFGYDADGVLREMTAL